MEPGHRVKIFCRRRLGRTYLLYPVLAALAAMAFRSDQAALNYLNSRRHMAEAVQSFADGGEFRRIHLQYCLRYYLLLAERGGRDTWWANTGYCYYSLGKKSPAMTAYQRAMSAQPQQYAHAWDLGRIAFESGDDRRSVEYMERALAAMPATVTVYARLLEKGAATDRTQRPPVIRMLNRAQGDFAAAHAILMAGHFYLGNERSMRRVYEQGRRQRPAERKLAALKVWLEQGGTRSDVAGKMTELFGPDFQLHFHTIH